MEQEFLSEAQIEERYPGEWVLVKQAEFDEQWHVVRGVVAVHSVDREDIDEAQAQLAPDEDSGNLARLCFKPWPKNVLILL